MRTLTLEESLKTARRNGIRTAKWREARNEKELRLALQATGFPAVIKVNSEKASHKSDAGGVALGLATIKQAIAAFRRMKRIPGFRSAIVQETAKGHEIILGAKRDVQFGPVLLIGMGGIYAEVLEDTAIALCPVSKGRALRMLKSLRGAKILSGIRGQEGIDFAAAAEQAARLSRMMAKHSEITEVDLNPVMASHKGAVAVDARIVEEE
ncbi:MAG: acetate--CoA ligase family protein [Candidatus Diapherotrites archaeon]|uniref:Acetate--CoA ligase family protein n=1 Tax=Candidatus Iainarchaeum sp. TaxID=3101447 RepID=A0A8T3YJF3_9ARCH|nr:acetate--CoA ligase family protein [Candidatus Diapherotrites archaeon]